MGARKKLGFTGRDLDTAKEQLAQRAPLMLLLLYSARRYLPELIKINGSISTTQAIDELLQALLPAKPKGRRARTAAAILALVGAERDMLGWKPGGAH